MAKKKRSSTPTRTASVVGMSLHSSSGFEVLGRTDQDGMGVVHYGYLTYIHGLPFSELFSDPGVRTEATARFTFLADGTINARHETGNIITTAAPGKLTIYHNDKPAGDFKNPKSFALGKPIARFDVRYFCILNVDLKNANVGAITACVELTQLSAERFVALAKAAVFGKSGLRQKASVAGEGWLTGRDPFRAYFLYGGQFSTVE